MYLDLDDCFAVLLFSINIALWGTEFIPIFKVAHTVESSDSGKSKIAY